MEKPCLYLKYRFNQVWWCMPVIPATREAEAGESLEPRRDRASLFWPRLECSGTVIAHRNCELLGSRDPPTSAFKVARTGRVREIAQLVLGASALRAALHRTFHAMLSPPVIHRQGERKAPDWAEKPGSKTWSTT
ncbi:hypothetical protein AAY473_026428 [Plecturocebus cupreus]